MPHADRTERSRQSWRDFKNGGQISQGRTPGGFHTGWGFGAPSLPVAGGVAFLQAGFKFKPIASRLEAADIDARKLTIEDISNLTGVPGFLLLGNNNISTTNIEILNRIFVQYTLRAWTKRIENEFNTKLFPQKVMTGNPADSASPAVV